MPPKRKSITRSQGTLAFGPHANKITKPTSTPPLHKPKSSPTTLSKAVTAELSTPSPPPEAKVEQETAPETPRTLAIRNQGAEKQAQGSEVEQQARKVSDAQVKRYWRKKEEERIAPRVHQKGLGLDEKVLRHFDLSSQYGPCVGIPRMKRWKRAEVLGLKPPIEVMAVLVKEEGKGNERVERAFMDELLTSRLTVNE
ncbi:hypothetical protein MMC21_003531 [Puttea exsequens]|nr:hypothetical protein [Puttea exsequens]